MLEDTAKGYEDFANGINNSASILSSFSDDMFISSDEKQELEENMQEVQDNINKIIRTAVGERRQLTEDEKKDLEKYFKELDELTQQEIEIEHAKADAISTQAEQESKTFNGSLQEYEAIAKKWISTATEQRDKTVKLAEERYTNELAQLNMAYKTEEERQGEHYQNELARITKAKEDAITQANDQVAKVSGIYADGYLERTQGQEDFYGHFKYWEGEIVKEQEKYNKELKRINDNQFADDETKKEQSARAYQNYQAKLKRIWSGVTDNMSEEQRRQYGVWLGLIGDVDLYGGKLSSSNQTAFNRVMAIWGQMPNDFRSTGADSIQGMINGMSSKEGSLFAKASNTATGVISRLSKMFKIGSPSKVMKEMFEYVIEGAEIGMDKEKGNLFKETEQIAKGVLDRFSFNSLSSRLQDAVDLENNKMSASLNNSISRNFTANISLDGTVEMDKKKVGRVVAPSVQRTFREAGAYVN